MLIQKGIAYDVPPTRNGTRGSTEFADIGRAKSALKDIRKKFNFQKTRVKELCFNTEDDDAEDPFSVMD